MRSRRWLPTRRQCAFSEEWQRARTPGVESRCTSGIWTLARGVWGQGYATETARASMEWAWSQLGAARLISLIAAENERSIHVAERLGMAATGHDAVRGVPMVVYEVARPA